MSSQLIIYGAAYGPQDMTGKVRSLRNNQELSIVANNDTFGDTWFGHKKSLIVVYKYDNPQAKVEVAIVKEGERLEVSVPPQMLKVKKDLSTFSLDRIGDTVSRQYIASPSSRIILGAAYGLKNVTDQANNFVTAKGEFDQNASNSIWGDGWVGKVKTLVVVYTYDDLIMLDVVMEHHALHFIVSPPLTILSAAYGLKDVTDKVNELVRNRYLSVTANNATFEDGWPGETKTLVIVYQYGEETPTVVFAKENDSISFLYSAKELYYGSTNPTTLTILGATYGPKDVSSTVKGLIKEDTELDFNANNGVFGDSWRGEVKSFVLVHRYARNAPQITVLPEHSQVTVKRSVSMTYVGLISSNNLLDNGDKFALKTVTNNYVSYDANEKVVATSDKLFLFTVKKESVDGPFKILGANGKYMIVDNDNYLHVTADYENATKFTLTISTKGGVRISVSGGLYIRIDHKDNSIRANSVDYFGASTIFDICLTQTSGVGELMSLEEISDCDLAWASFIWAITGGFFLAIGIGPFIAIGKVQPGVLGIIKSSPRAWAAIQKLAKGIIDGIKANTKAVVTGLFSVMGILYHEGILWTIFKWMLTFGSWLGLTMALAKIIEIIFLPELEIADLLASFTVWAIRTIDSGLELGRCQS